MSQIRGLILLLTTTLMLAAVQSPAAKAPPTPPSPAQAPAIVVAVQPVLVMLPVGSTAAVQVSIENPTDLFGFDIWLAFDPSVVQIEDSDPERPGVQVGLGSLLDGRDYFAVSNVVDNEAGTIHVVVTLLGAGSPINENGDLIAMSVHGESSGVSPLALTTVTLADTQAGVLSADLVDGVIIVGVDITMTPDATHTPTATPSLTATSTSTPPPTTTPTITPNPTPLFTQTIQLPLILRDFQAAPTAGSQFDNTDENVRG